MKRQFQRQLFIFVAKVNGGLLTTILLNAEGQCKGNDIQSRRHFCLFRSRFTKSLYWATWVPFLGTSTTSLPVSSVCTFIYLSVYLFILSLYISTSWFMAGFDATLFTCGLCRENLHSSFVSFKYTWSDVMPNEWPVGCA